MLVYLILSLLVTILASLLLKKPAETLVVKLLRWKQRRVNKEIYAILDRIPTTDITRTTIPASLRSRMHVINIPNFKELGSAREKCDVVLTAFCEDGVGFWKDTCRTDLVVFDVLEHNGAYFPSMHTDIEWNKVSNDGFQVWCLEYNENSSKKGNMFVFENDRLAKYKDTKYFVRMEDDKILVVGNCLHAENIIGSGVRQDYVLETMTPEEFIESTKKYYLDFEEGDCMVFDTNLLHMSDYRDASDLRRSFNFRVALKDENGDLRLDPKGCGYVNSVSYTVKDPSKFALVPS